MQIKFTLDKGAYKPEKAHEADAGYDLRARMKRCSPSGMAVRSLILVCMWRFREDTRERLPDGQDSI